MKTFRLFGMIWAAALFGAVAAENLDRGLVVVKDEQGQAFLSWRLLQTDPTNVAFEVYRAPQTSAPRARLTPTPLRGTCSFVDRQPLPDPAIYYVRALGGDTVENSRPFRFDPAADERGYIRVKLQSKVRAQKVGLADFDGDGALEYLVKHPDFNTDPYQRPGYWKKSQEPYQLEAYRQDGTLLWRYDMGWAIEEGIWYSPIVAFDLDGDGQAEVYTKAGEGDPRDPDGRVTSGPEWLVKLDGRSGRVVARQPWPSREGFDEYNYYCRNLLGVAYLDGKLPHLIVKRGTYRIIKIQTYTPDLKPGWYWEASGPHESYRGQGTHGLQVADIDEDGRDELVIGAAAIDDNGQPLWNTRLGHPDVCYVADFDPARAGLEIFYGIEPRRASNGVCLVSARTGEMLWGYEGPTTHVHGQGMVGDIDPKYPGIEVYAGEQNGSNYWLYTAQGKRLSNQSLGELAPKAVFWTEEPTKVLVTGGKIRRWQGPVLGQIEGRIVAIADCLGDWREEIITSLEGELRIYTTTIPARTRRTCLMQDRQYRLAVAMQTMGYFYPPQVR